MRCSSWLAGCYLRGSNADPAGSLAPSAFVTEGEKNFFGKSSHATLQLNLVNGRVLNQVI